MSPFLTPAGWHEEKYVYWKVSVGLKCMRMVVESLAHSPFPADLNQQCPMSDVRCRTFQVGCRMLDFNKSDVGFLQVGCRIFTSRMSDFYKSDVGF